VALSPVFDPIHQSPGARAPGLFCVHPLLEPVMNADIQRLIDLQRLDSTALDAKRRVSDEPARLQSLDERLESARHEAAVARERLNDNQAARREIEKQVAVHQGRLGRFRDQLMSVKTNIEYQAMQKEIEFAQNEVKALEDKVLERMLEADELTADVKRTESELVAVQKTVDTDRRALATEVAELRQVIERAAIERASLIGGLDPKVLATFEAVASRRHGVAVALASQGVCTICHVRLRPQVFNSVRRNEEIIQCDSCQRILYFAPAVVPDAAQIAP
jgi:predicted  nucleic acid-binding Zn-ribbon protein